MTTWLKAKPAAAYAGDVDVKTLYAAVKAGDLKAARIGAGRNLLFCTEWIDAWLAASATQGGDLASLKTEEASRAANAEASYPTRVGARNGDARRLSHAS